MRSSLGAGRARNRQRLTSYKAGVKVLFHRLPYESKWDNQGVSPGTAASDPGGSAWKPLFRIPGEPAG